MAKLISKGKGCLINVCRPSKTSDAIEWNEAFVHEVIHDPSERDPDWLYRIGFIWNKAHSSNTKQSVDYMDVDPDRIKIKGDC